MITKYIPQENTETILKLLNKCLELEPNIKFHILDTEGYVGKSRNPEKIIQAIDGGDEELGINCMIDEECIGWFGILPYEEYDIVYDCSDNNFCNYVGQFLLENESGEINE